VTSARPRPVTTLAAATSAASPHSGHSRPGAKAYSAPPTGAASRLPLVEAPE